MIFSVRKLSPYFSVNILSCRNCNLLLKITVISLTVVYGNQHNGPLRSETTNLTPGGPDYNQTKFPERFLNT